MGKKLVIVESPTKAKTISRFLPRDYQVKASMGHVRDLPASAAEIPEKYKGEPWSRLGVDVEHDFDPLYVIPDKKRKLITELKAALKEADELILATDEDREGESIGWHLQEVLKPKQPVRRMVFHEITREAIEQALRETRDIDLDLVHAQETRRILDRLVGYTVSPLLWRKIAPKLSAGRVQSVAVRLLVLRERERRAFVAGQYWDLRAFLNKRPDQPNHRFEATLVAVGGKRVATGRDFDEQTGQIAAGKDVLLLNQQEAETLRQRLLTGQWVIAEVEEKDATRAPYAPFTTSTLQQEANRKLGLSARETMRLAQNLYENGYITYMRTDSVNLSEEAINAARRRIREMYGEEYLSPSPRRYQTRTANAQEAHEAIRPAGDQMMPADSLPLEGREKSLYDLIWKRTVASQMANARLKLRTVMIEVADAVFRASGRTVIFPGFFRAYVEGSDDPEAALESQEQPLPALVVGEQVDCRDLEVVGHETQPPARYTEATLVKALEAEGIGRPSTYATIIDTIQQRGYVFKQRKELVPTFTAFAVTELLEKHFDELVDLKFTANMEQRLDDIATGAANYLSYLREFYLGEDGLENQVKSREAAIDPRLASTVELGNLHAEVRIGQYGPYLTREENGERRTANLPPTLPPADLTDEVAEALFNKKVEGPQVIGNDPESELPVLLKVGPYGPYVQLGEDDPNSKTKPRRASLLKGMTPDDLTMETAMALLSLPRTLGEHPETGKPVQAGVGRFGPFVVHDGVYANLRAQDNVLEIDLDRALELLAAKTNGGGRRSTAKAVIKEVGEHPEGGPVQVLEGRYGPYVSWNKINATLPKDVSPGDVTLEQALTWLTEKQARPKSTRKSGVKTAQPAAEKTTRPAAKKAAATKKRSGASDAKPAPGAKSKTATKAKTTSPGA
ncbi:MAG TPA: type I DNA topoisomerase [Chloroflexi bacterium]|nr:type I DNA topoisomerase [Chloroflexota bacterium]